MILCSFTGFSWVTLTSAIVIIVKPHTECGSFSNAILLSVNNTVRLLSVQRSVGCSLFVLLVLIAGTVSIVSLCSTEDYGDPCINYVRLNQPERRVTNRISVLNDSALCDRSLRRRWYRFDGPGAESCPRRVWMRTAVAPIRLYG